MCRTTRAKTEKSTPSCNRGCRRDRHGGRGLMDQLSVYVTIYRAYITLQYIVHVVLYVVHFQYPPPPPLLRYLVDMRWMKQWRKYVGYDTWDQSSAGEPSANPGPVDNSNLFKGGEMTVLHDTSCVTFPLPSSPPLPSPPLPSPPLPSPPLPSPPLSRDWFRLPQGASDGRVGLLPLASGSVGEVCLLVRTQRLLPPHRTVSREPSGHVTCM